MIQVTFKIRNSNVNEDIQKLKIGVYTLYNRILISE